MSTTLYIHIVQIARLQALWFVTQLVHNRGIFFSQGFHMINWRFVSLTPNDRWRQDWIGTSKNVADRKLLFSCINLRHEVCQRADISWSEWPIPKIKMLNPSISVMAEEICWHLKASFQNSCHVRWDLQPEGKISKWCICLDLGVCWCLCWDLPDSNKENTMCKLLSSLSQKHNWSALSPGQAGPCGV